MFRDMGPMLWRIGYGRDGRIHFNGLEVIQEKQENPYKVNAKTREVSYVIDGIEAAADSLNGIPKVEIATVNRAIPRRMPKSYVISFDRKGQFISYANGVLIQVQQARMR